MGLVKTRRLATLRKRQCAKVGKTKLPLTTMVAGKVSCMGLQKRTTYVD